MTITEVVFYQIKADRIANYVTISQIADSFLQERKGFLSRTVKQDSHDKSLFLDIVEWQTMDDALHAMEASQKEPALFPFFEAFKEVIRINHFYSLS